MGMNYFILLFLFFCFSCQQNKGTINNVEEIASAKKINPFGIAVKTVEITPEIFQKQILSNGKIEAKYKNDLRFKTSDKIRKITVRNGQFISKGQTIAVLENDLIANQKEKAEIDFDKAKQQLIEEKINYGYNGIIDDSIPPQILKNLYINSNYRETKNALENIKILYQQTILKSPISGAIANLESKEGNFVSTSDIFCSVIAQKDLEVSFTILENELPYTKKGQAITIELFSATGTDYKGVITEINPQIGINGLVKIKASITNSSQSIFDGMNAKVSINTPLKDVIVIPKSALVLRSNKEVVFTLENGLAKWNYVEVVAENNTSYAIKKEINIGDTVIVEGNLNLSHDAKVQATSLELADTP